LIGFYSSYGSVYENKLVYLFIFGFTGNNKKLVLSVKNYM